MKDHGGLWYSGSMVDLLEFLYLSHYHNPNSPFHHNTTLYAWINILTDICAMQD